MSKRFACRLSLAVMLLVAPLSAQTSATQAAQLPSPFEGAPFSMSASAIRSASASVPADKISDATILYEETDYRISAAGTLNFIHRIVYRIETNSGVEGWAEASMDWDPSIRILLRSMLVYSRMMALLSHSTKKLSPMLR